jgi:transglutaminase-like putative cysteine protease
MISQQMPVSTPTTTLDDVKTRPQETTESGAMVYSPARPVTMRYQFVNQHPGAVELWLSLPPELPTQRDVQISDMTPEPVSIELDGNGINRLAYFRLEPGVELRFTLHAQLYRAQFTFSAPSAGVSLSDQERATYLRSSPMIQVTDDVCAEAQRIVGDAVTPFEQARRLYRHLIKHYSYKWPPAARGSEAMRRNKRGDCGEYSWLYAAWCRALGIPCRVMVGTHARGTMRAHVWNEVFIDSIGWIPLDTTMYQTGLRMPGIADVDWRLRLQRRFGRISPDRFVFSIDPDLPLRPTYHDQLAPATYERFMFGGKNLAFGFESLDGAAPYLQPVYLRMTEVQTSSPEQNTWNRIRDTVLTLVWPPFAMQSAARFLGVWRFADTIGYRVWVWFAWAGLVFGIVNGALELVDVNIYALQILGTLGYILINVWLMQQVGVRWWIVVVILLFVFKLTELLL